MKKRVVSLFLCSLIAIGCGGVDGDDGDADEETDTNPPVITPPDGGGGEGEDDLANINFKVCLIERFDAASGDLIYRDVRTYALDNQFLILDRDTDGDGLMNDQYRYSYVGGRYSIIDLDRDLNGEADWLRTYVHDDNGDYDYYLEDTGALVDGVYEMTLAWTWVVDYKIVGGATTETVYDNTVDLNFSDDASDFFYRYNFEYDEDSRVLSQTRTYNSEVGVDFVRTYVWEDGLLKERHYDLGEVDGVIDRSEFRLHDSDNRVEQIQHDRDGDGTMDWIERYYYEGC